MKAIVTAWGQAARKLAQAAEHEGEEEFLRILEKSSPEDDELQAYVKQRLENLRNA